jgi:hypothetical protein
MTYAQIIDKYIAGYNILGRRGKAWVLDSMRWGLYLSRLDSVLLFVFTFGTITPYLFVYYKHVECLLVKYMHDWRSSIH